MIADVSGIICDGAKAGCALKVATVVNSAFRSARLALRGLGAGSLDGIVSEEVETSIRNIGRLGNEGMADADRVIPRHHGRQITKHHLFFENSFKQQREELKMDKRTRVLNAIQQKEVDHVPVGFWYHFDGDQAMGDPCVQAHLDYYESTGLDFIKIMCDGYFPIPCRNR